MSQISFGGIASGLDTGAIIDALMGSAKTPILQLESQKAKEQKKLDLVGSLEAKVEALRDKAKALSSLSGFLKTKSTISDESAASITLTDGALTGSHTLEVLSLAMADRYTWDGVADGDTTELGAGSFDFSYNGTDYSVSVDDASSTLNGIASAINSEAGEDVTASVVNTGTDASPSYQLVVAGNDTGEDFALSGLSTSIAGLTNASQIATAANASIKVDGLTIERSTNEFTGVLEGVEIDALSATSGPITFTVESDSEAIKEGLNGFIEAYNEVVSFIEGQNKYSEDDGAGGELFGDTILRSVKSLMQGSLFNVSVSTVQADTAGFSTLSLVGIDLGVDGKLTMNESKVDEKLSEDLDAFADLFADTDGFDNGGAAENTAAFYIDTSEDSGLFSTLFRALDQATETVVSENGTALKGLFGRREDTYKSNIDRMGDRIEELERRLDKYEETLVAQFTSLEQLMGGLNAQQGFLNNLTSF